MNKILVIISCTALSWLRAQSDSILYISGQNLPDGIYLTYADLRYNTPVLKEQVMSDINKDQLEFVGKVMMQKEVQYMDQGIMRNFKPENVWGFVQNNVFFINHRDEFYRVPVFGSISFFVARVVVVNPMMYDVRFGYPAGTGRSTELREFLFDYLSGRVYDFNLENFRELISRDEILHTSFRKLSRSKQRSEMYRYIRKYNEQHAVYFLGNQK